MIFKLNFRLALFAAFFLSASFPVSSMAEQAEICGVNLAVDQISEIDDKNVKLVVFGETVLIPKTKAAETVLISYLKHSSEALSFGADKWKGIFDNCLKAKKPELAALTFILYAGSSQAKGTVNTDYIEAVFLDKADSLAAAKEISQLREFRVLDSKIKNPIFLALGIDDVHWLRVNLLGKSFYLSEDFQNYCEAKLTDSLKVKNIPLAKKIAYLLEALFIANAEKYKKYNLACNLIEELLSNGADLSSNKLLTLVSIRNTDDSLRAVLDPFLIEGFHSLAKSAIERQKYDEALSLLSSINADQATPTTFEIIKLVITKIDPSSKVLANETVNALLANSAANDNTLNPLLHKLYSERTLRLLEVYNLNDALKTFESFKALSKDEALLRKLKFDIAIKFLRLGNKEEANKYLAQLNLTFVDRFKLFLDGYYGHPVLYVLVILVPLIAKLAYEFFTKASAVSNSVPRMEPVEKTPGAGLRTTATPEEEVANFVSSRVAKQKNPLFDEYNDCLAIFELQKGADLKTIKTAYRNAVRKIHPDLNASHQSADDASRFVELTKTYDRVRELHRLLGFEEK